MNRAFASRGMRWATPLVAAATTLLAGCGWNDADRRAFERVCTPEFGDTMCGCMAKPLERARVRPSRIGESMLDVDQPEPVAKAIDAAIEACANTTTVWPAIYGTKVLNACLGDGYPQKFCECFLDGVQLMHPWPAALNKLARGKVLAVEDSEVLEKKCMPFAGDKWWPGAIQGAAEGCRERGRSAEECGCMARALSELVPFPLFLEYAAATQQGKEPPKAVVEQIERAKAGCLQQQPPPADPAQQEAQPQPPPSQAASSTTTAPPPAP